MEEKKLSIIVPLYNTENYIQRCLDSICRQTYQNLEILVVNDASKDNSVKIVKDCMARDNRIKLLMHNQNRGLFHARITGVEAASGDYIAFVDSDDYISCDFFRSLVYRAAETNSDIVVGKIVHEDERGYRYIHNLYHDYDFGILENEDILRAYWEQEGRCFIWHTIWNKVYSRHLWEKALPFLKQQEKHLIMTEDFVFSSVLFNFANRLSSSKYGVYYYFQHSGASTSTSADLSKFNKMILDLKTAFDFVKNFIQTSEYRIEAIEQFKKWSDLYVFFWKGNIEKSPMNDTEKKSAMQLLEDSFTDYGNEILYPSYFYQVTTEYDNRFDNLVETVCNGEIECLSLDIFDTAVIRPFYQPTDLFSFMNQNFKKLLPNERRQFQNLRIRAEEILRTEKLYGKVPLQEDITLDEIYDKIAEISSIDKNILFKMEVLEKELEIKFCSARKSIFYLYQAAIHCGKRIYFTSDMYLPFDTIKNILEKSGYKEYEDILISCEQNASKRTGKMFEILLEKTGYSPGKILHVGDNWDTDVVKAREKGIHAQFYSSPMNCIQYNIPDIKTTHSCCPYTEPSGNIFNFEKAIQFLGTRSALAVAANNIYDNPFISFNEWTEMNCSPFFLGGYALGMHLLGFVKWFTEKSIVNEYETLLFIARDGYLPMKAYEIFRSCYPYSPSAEYLYTSRKAGFAAGIHHAQDLFSLYDQIDPKSCTFEQFLKLVSPIINAPDRTELKKAGYDFNKPIGDYGHFCKFIQYLIENAFNQDKNNIYQSNLKEYFAPKLFGKTACVDIGYSGRTQEMLKNVTNLEADAFYVHTNDGACAEREREKQFKVYSFYDATPSITGGAREVLFSKFAPSCIGYTMENEEISPLFEEEKTNYPAKYLITEIQKAALAFVGDFVRYFGNDIELMEMRSLDVSYPYEYFLSTLTDADSKMFDCFLFEDDMWAGKTMKLSDYWKECICYHKIIPYYMQGKDANALQMNAPYKECEMEYKVYIQNELDKKSLVKKALYWYLVDKNFFKQRLKERKKEIRSYKQ